MSFPRICIAGIETESGEHVRPVTDKQDLITRSLLAENGGPLRLAARVELGPTTPDPRPPETEDQWCETSSFETLEILDHDAYWDLLGRVGHSDLNTAFGDALQREGRSYAVEVGRGERSLGCVRAAPDERLVLDHGLRLRDRQNALIGVTDLRFFGPDQKRPRTELVEEVNASLHAGTPAYLMFGLARAWKRDGEDRSLHWLQLNGICLGDDPLGSEP